MENIKVLKIIWNTKLGLFLNCNHNRIEEPGDSKNLKNRLSNNYEIKTKTTDQNIKKTQTQKGQILKKNVLIGTQLICSKWKQKTDT